MAKLDLLKALLKNELKYLQRNASRFRKNYNIWEIQFFIKERGFSV